MGNGASFGNKRPTLAPASTSRWPDDLGRIETWQQHVQEADANGSGIAGAPLVEAGGRMGNSSRVPLAHSLSCPEAATDPSLHGPAVAPIGRMVPPCTSQGLHFDSAVKVYCVSSRPNFLQVSEVCVRAHACVCYGIQASTSGMYEETNGSNHWILCQLTCLGLLQSLWPISIIHWGVVATHTHSCSVLRTDG